ncbi:MAG: membrane-bound lytic murein transglycosylase A [Desulforhopalus sp.]|jgi:membrane-bound lytic murein transglycosylase A
MINRGRITTSVLLVILAIVGIAIFLYLYDPYRPLHDIKPLTSLTDDLDRKSLIQVLESHKHYLARQSRDEEISVGSHQFTNDWLHNSVSELLDFLRNQPDKEQLSIFLQTNYLFFQAGGRKKKSGRKMLVTGYYEPLFQGSLTKEAPYLTPLYSPPSSLVQLTDADGKKQVGRYNKQHKFTTFWTRQEIETEHHLDGNELVYLKDPFDAYLLHVQGSGKIALPDGSVKSIGFAGTNGMTYKSIGKYLVDQKIMKLKEVNIPAIREYLTRHPSELLPLLHQNPRYIFFQWRDDKGPRGSSGEPLTAGRSIAIDHQSLPGGAIAYLISQKPRLDSANKIESWQPMNRFVLPQDSGSAIKGTGRVDVFWGNGIYAETAANHMKQPGKLYFLVKKGFKETGVQ